MKPIRVQRKRVKGYKMPENTVSVTRPGKWSNPFLVNEEIKIARGELEKFSMDGQGLARQWATNIVVDRFRAMMLNPDTEDDEPIEPKIRERFVWMREHLHELKGKNLACFCDRSTACHATVLLELANKEASEVAGFGSSPFIV